MTSSHEEQLRSACDALEKLIRAGEKHAVESVLAENVVDQDNEDLVVELIYNEFLIREELGLELDVDEYFSRFPQFRERVGNLLSIHSALESGELDANAQSEGNRTAAVQRLSPGDWIGPYELEQLLGRGGMGLVFKSRHSGLNRVVALKILRQSIANPQELRRFMAEARTVAKLQHPNVVQVFETDIFESFPFIALEYMSGGTLEQNLKPGPMPARSAAIMMVELANAIQFAHDEGVIHRDLKPGNVLLSENGTPKIADFGLAKRYGGSVEEAPVTMTETGAILGTPGYMSPEQARGDKSDIDSRTDIYGLGAILYQMLTGQPPFTGETPLDTLQNIQSIDPVSPSKLNPQLPRDLVTICLKCLEKEPARRYASAAELAADLARFLGGRPIIAKPVSLAGRTLKLARRHPAVATLLMLFLTSLLAGFAGMTFLWSRAERGRLSEAEQRKEALFNLYVQQVGLAQREIKSGDSLRGEEILNNIESSRRGWEWHYLQSQCAAAKPEIAFESYRPEMGIRDTDYSPDGKQIAICTGGFNVAEAGRLMTIDAVSGKTLWEAEGHEGSLHDLAYSPDGNLIATVEAVRSVHGTLTLWDANTGQAIKNIASGNSEAAFALAFHPDGKRIAVGTASGVIEIWDWEKETHTTLPRLHYANIYGLDFDPEGKWLASAGRDALRLWDVGQARLRWELHQGEDTRGVEFSPDGRRLVAHGYDRTVQIWDLLFDPPRVRRLSSVNVALAANFTSSGRYLAAIAPEFSEYDLHYDRLKITELASKLPARSLAPVPNVGSMAVIDGNGRVRRLMPNMSTEPRHVSKFSISWLENIAISREGRFVAMIPRDNRTRTGDQEFHVAIMDREDFFGKAIYLEGLPSWSSDATFVGDDRFAVACNDGCVHLFEIASRKLLGKSHVTKDAKVLSIAWQADTNTLVTVDSRGMASLTAVTPSGELKRNSSVKLLADITTCDITDDGRRVAIGNQAGEVAVWTCVPSDETEAPLKLEWKFSPLDEIRVVRWDEHGDTLVLANAEKAELWAFGEVRKKLWSVSTPQMDFNSFAFLPDGNRLAAASSLRSSVHLFDRSNGSRVAEFKNLLGEAFSPKTGNIGVDFLPPSAQGRNWSLCVKGLRQLYFLNPEVADDFPSKYIDKDSNQRTDIQWHCEQGLEAILLQSQFGADFHSRRALALLKELVAKNGNSSFVTNYLMLARMTAAFAGRQMEDSTAFDSLVALAKKEYAIAAKDFASSGVPSNDTQSRIRKFADRERERAYVRLGKVAHSQWTKPDRIWIDWGMAAIESDPNQPWNYWFMGIAHHRNGDFESAVSSFEQAGSLWGDKSRWHEGLCYWMAMSHWRLGNQEAANGYLRLGDEKTGSVSEVALPLWIATLRDRAREDLKSASDSGDSR